MRANRVAATRFLAGLSAVAAALATGIAGARPPAAAAQQFAPVTVEGERLRTEGPFSAFVYEALGATPRIALPALRAAAARPVAPGATATSPFVYEQLGATPSLRLPARALTSTDTAR